MNKSNLGENNKQPIVTDKNSVLMTPTTQGLIHKIVTGLSNHNTNILLLGETGVGKTYVAEQAVKCFAGAPIILAIHRIQISARSAQASRERFLS